MLRTGKFLHAKDQEGPLRDVGHPIQLMDGPMGRETRFVCGAHKTLFFLGSASPIWAIDGRLLRAKDQMVLYIIYRGALRRRMLDPSAIRRRHSLLRRHDNIRGENYEGLYKLKERNSNRGGV